MGSQRGAPAQVELLMVVGTPFSGSTLLAALVDEYLEIASVGELTGPVATVDGVCSCGRPLSTCPRWNEISAAMAERGIEFGVEQWNTRVDAVPIDLTASSVGRRLARQILDRSLRSSTVDRLRDTLLWRIRSTQRQLSQGIDRSLAVADVVATDKGVGVFLDASKDPVRAERLHRWSNRRVRVIHLVRDSPSFVASYQSRRPQRWSVVRGIRQWRRSVAAAERLGSTVSGDLLVMRYEDLCSHPTDELRRLADWMDLPAPSAPITSSKANHLLGSTTSREGRRAVALNETWRDELAPWAQTATRTLTGKRRRSLGYDDRR